MSKKGKHLKSGKISHFAKPQQAKIDKNGLFWVSTLKCHQNIQKKLYNNIIVILYNKRLKNTLMFQIWHFF